MRIVRCILIFILILILVIVYVFGVFLIAFCQGIKSLFKRQS